MKKIFFFLVLAFIASHTQAQQIDKKVFQQATFISGNSISDQFDCNPRTLISCNYISNNNFIASPYDPFNNREHMLNPFGINLVQDWIASHGSPQITDGIWDFDASVPYWIHPPSTPPSPATGYTYTVSFPNDFGNAAHEGFAQKIPELTQGKKYMFSFFDKLPIRPIDETFPVQSYKIILMHCSDAENIFTYPEFIIPILPPNSFQTIICKTDITNTDWQQYVSEFTASQNFNMILFYPQNAPGTFWTGASLAYPELIDIQDFSAGEEPNPQPGNCIVKIGPEKPNCGVANALFTWHGPNGIPPIVVPSSDQQIFVDAGNSLNVGIWTLRMTVPNTQTPNGGCSQVIDIFATVNVPPCCSQPIVTPGGPIEYFIPLDFSLIGGLKLSSSYSIGNQWYFNNQPIIGATNQDFIFPTNTSSPNSGIYYTRVNGCNSNAVNVTFNYYGYGFFGEENWASFGAKILPTGSSTFFCKNTSNNFIKQFDQGTMADYSWNIITLPGYGPQYLYITPGSTNLHSNIAAIDFSNIPAIPGLLPGFGYNFVQGISDLNGQQKILDFAFYTSPSDIVTWYTCLNQVHNIYAMQNSWTTLPGRTLFDWEDYDFGPNSTIITPNPGSYPDPNDPLNIHKLHIPGRGAFTSSIQVSFSGPSVIHKNFYYNSPIGGCYKEDYNIVASYPGCLFHDPEDSIQINLSSIYPNPSSNQITISSKYSIEYIQISDLMNPTLKTIKANGLKSITINLFELNPGIYNCKIITSKGIENQKLVIQR